MSHIVSRPLICLILLCVFPRVASAVPVIFSDRATFDAATGGGLNFESFEDPFAEAPSVDFDGFSFTESGSTIQNAVRHYALGGGLDYQVTDGSGAASYEHNNFSSAFTITFDSPVNAFGFDISSESSVTAIFGGDIDAMIDLVADTPQFFGYFDPMASFSTVTLQWDPFGGITAFDAFSFGNTGVASVSEPGVLALLAIAIAGFSPTRRKNKS